MSKLTRVAAAPPEPRSATAAFGSTRPALTSAGSIRFGKLRVTEVSQQGLRELGVKAFTYVGNTGLSSRASAERPAYEHSQLIIRQCVVDELPPYPLWWLPSKGWRTMRDRQRRSPEAHGLAKQRWLCSNSHCRERLSQSFLLC